MPLQRRLLYVMLALLGMAALAGVATIFVQSRDFVGRIAGTLVIAAIALALAIPFSKKLEVEKSRVMGLAGMGATVVGFCLALAAIWASFFIGAMREEKLAILTLAYVGAVVPGLGFFSLYRVGGGKGRLAGGVGMGLSVAVFGLWCRAIWTAWSSSEPAIEAAGVLIAAAAPLCGSLYGLWRERWVLSLRWIGVLASVVGIVLGQWGVWARSSEDPTIVVQAFIVAAAFAILNVLLRLALPGWQRVVVMGVIGVAFFAAIAGSIYNVSTAGGKLPSTPVIEHVERMVVASVIVLVCGLLALGVLAAMNRKSPATVSGPIKEIARVRMTCPHCGLAHDAPVGNSNCPGCALAFSISVSEPRCAKCDYVLLGVRSKVCPECGWEIGRAAEASPLA